MPYGLKPLQLANLQKQPTTEFERPAHINTNLARDSLTQKKIRPADHGPFHRANNGPVSTRTDRRGTLMIPGSSQ